MCILSPFRLRFDTAKMIIPVRCFTCGKVVGNLWERYQGLLKTHDANSALDQLGLKRFLFFVKFSSLHKVLTNFDIDCAVVECC
jgi:DNA-directed RNA polymerase subunit N (RpoN/RPB10)